MAYEEIAVTDRGMVTETISLSGKVPAPKRYNLTTLPDQVYCGQISDGRSCGCFSRSTSETVECFVRS